MADPLDKTPIVLVQLLDEGVEVYRPVRAKHLHDNVYRLGITHDDHSGDETWEFPPGSLVECTLRVLDKGPVLVATQLAQS